MDKQPCLPVKITAKKWADKLQDGSVFMRSLYDFGSWSAIERHNRSDSQMKDGVQGDIGEGIVKTVDPKVGDEFFNCFDPEIIAVMKDMYYIDENFYQYSKSTACTVLHISFTKNDLSRQMRGCSILAILQS